jgi:hypothetical protein
MNVMQCGRPANNSASKQFSDSGKAPPMDSLPTRFQKEVFAPYLQLLKAQFRIHLHPGRDLRFATVSADFEWGRSHSGHHREKCQCG